MRVEVAREFRPPTEVLIPEARQHQRRRYIRTAIVSVLSALIVAALTVGAFVLASGTGAIDDKSSPVALSSATTSKGPVALRPVLCFAAPYSQSAEQASGPLPSCGSQYLLTAAALNVTPHGGTPGFSLTDGTRDPAFAPYLSTADDENATGSEVLLPSLFRSAAANGGERFVLGPAAMKLNASDVRSADAREIPIGGGHEWIVMVQFSAGGAAKWDAVAQGTFHQLLAIEQGGVVVSAPIIQPAQTSFSSFEGKMEISGTLSKREATSLAEGIRSRA